MNRIESLFARLFLALTTIFITFALIESAANFYLWNIADEETFKFFATIQQVKDRYGQDFYIASKDLLYVAHPYLGFVTSPNYRGGRNFHNSLGFRGEEFSIEKPEDVYRIVAIGASTTYGTGERRPTNTYPALLQQYLRDAEYSNIEVINAGVGAYTSYESLINLQQRVLQLNPDLILIYQGSNDIHTRFVYPPEVYLGDNTGYLAPPVIDTVLPEIWEYSTILRMIGIQLGWTTSQSSIDWARIDRAPTAYFGELDNQYNGGVYPSGFFTEVSGMEMLEANPPIHFERNLRSMVGLSRTHGADVLLMTYIIHPEFDDYKAYSPEYQFGTAQHNDITRQVADDMNTHFVDLAEVFPLDKDYFTDGRHMTREGNRIRAELVGEYIIANILETDSE